MPREIINVSVGQCGNQIGSVFWETILEDHLLDANGNFTGDLSQPKDAVRAENIEVYFREGQQQNRYVPRSVLVDLECGVMDKIKSSKYAKLFPPDNYVYDVNGAANCWAVGYNTYGFEMCPEIMDTVRIEVERCDCPQAFQIVHSIGGGTGSGLSCLLLERFMDLYPNILRCDFTVYPSKNVSDTVVEPYNAVLSLPTLIQCCDENFIIDNEALFNISTNVTKMGTSYAELNHLVASVMSGVTSSLRFPGSLNCDLRKLGVNLVPFPRLHFFACSMAPLYSHGNSHYNKTSIGEIMAQMWHPDHYFARIDPDAGKFLTVAALFRGKVSSNELERETRNIQDILSDDFVNWIPDRFKTSNISVPSPIGKVSGTFVGNTTAVRSMFQRYIKQYSSLFKRKAFLHTYKSCGMDEMHFEESAQDIKDLIQEYQDRNDVIVDLEVEEEDELEEEFEEDDLALNMGAAASSVQDSDEEF